MSTSKSKFLVSAVVVLLLANIALLLYFLCWNNGPAKPQGNRRDQAMIDFLKKDIGFSDAQMQLYDTLSKEHKQRMKTGMDTIRANRQELYKTLGQHAFSDTFITITVAKSSELQQQMEIGMLVHFKKIRQICSPEQLPKFDSLFYKMWNKKPEKKDK